MKTYQKYILGLLLGIVLFAFLFVPKIVDKTFNKVSAKPPYAVNRDAQILYDSLEFVADMHCDALLWKRDLLQKKRLRLSRHPTDARGPHGFAGFYHRNEGSPKHEF
jgi:hypothetical protein